MRTKTGSVHNITRAPRRFYLLGYVAGIVYHDGSEWLLTKAGHWQNDRPNATKEDGAHQWPTREQAEIVARRADSDRFPAFTRAYVYETAIPEHAKGLAELTDETNTARRFVRLDCAQALQDRA